MKLIRFRIQHYKSIKDSGWCWLASDVTTLAGKNESGKSAILEALRDFETDVKSIPDGAKPIDDSGKPMIEMCFEVGKSILDEIAEETGITLADETRKYVSKKWRNHYQTSRWQVRFRGKKLILFSISQEMKQTQREKIKFNTSLAIYQTLTIFQHLKPPS